jgi:hypothetical protein
MGIGTPDWLDEPSDVQAAAAILVAFSTIVLVIITARYVTATGRLAASAEASTRFTQFSLVPHLYPTAKVNERDLLLALINPSPVPAYDVEVSLEYLFHEDDISLESFAEAHMAREPPVWQVNDEGFFGVLDHIAYSIFPPGYQVESTAHTPLLPDTLYIWVQFKSQSGINIGYVAWMFREGSRYRMGALDPDLPSETPRIDPVEATRERAEPYLSQFLAYSDHCAPSGYLKAFPISVEDRGEWHPFPNSS